MPISSETARRNALIGGGRPKGSLSKTTLLKQKMQTAFNQRVYRMTDKLLSSQVIAALGTHRMVVITKGDDGKPQLETVRDQKRMDNLLDIGEYGKDYMILSGAEPDWKAANALLDRAYGKAKESLEVDATVKFSLKGLAERRKSLDLENIIEVEALPEA